MRKLSIYFLLMSCIPTTSVFGAGAFSEYGLVQNVQSYSSNPFYNPNGSYNQNPYPTIIYATGADVGTGECQNITSFLVNSYCDARNNCNGMQLDDVKPYLTVQLSKMSGNNYVTSCGGYIDSAFYNYQKTSNNIESRVSFPTPILFPQNQGTELKNFKMSDTEARASELEKLQNQNGANDFALTATEMPKTINDVSFQTQIANKTAGYEPFKEVWETTDTGEYVCVKNCSYQTPHLETTKEMYKRQAEEINAAAEVAAAQKRFDKERLSKIAFCKKYPGDPECPDKNANLQKCSDTNNNGVMVDHGITVPCKTDTGADGMRTCIDGIFEKCKENNIANTSSVDSEPDMTKLNEIINALKASRKK